MNKDEALRRSDRVGRNTPCLCGSGKKYKHCHLLSAIRSKGDTRMEIAMHAMMGRPCILCNTPADGAGLFVPTEKWKQDNPRPNGIERTSGNTLVYPMCSRCMERAKGTDEVELRLEEINRAEKMLHDAGDAA